MKIIRIIIPLLLGFTQIGLSQWIVYNPGNTKGIRSAMVSSVLEDQNNNLWFGTDQGITCLDTRTSTWKTYNTSYGLLNAFIYQVYGDKEGNIWAATNGGGIGRFSDNNWSVFTVENGLSYNVVRAIDQSPEGTMWFGTYGHGICSYRSETGFKKITADGIKDAYVLSIMALSDNEILSGTLNEGLLIFKNGIAGTILNEDELSGKRVFCIFRDHAGNIWLGTDQGAQQYDPSANTVSSCPASLAGKRIYSITENPDNDLIFASDDKIFIETGGIWSSFVPDNLNSSTSFYAAYYDSNGYGWFGSSNQGLFKKAGSTWYNFYNSTGLNENYFRGLCEDMSHNMLFSSYMDIYRFDGQNWTSVALKAGITDTYFGEMISDHSGNIWCVTYNRGLYKYDGHSWTNYSTAAYFNNDYPQNLAIDPDGNIWIGMGGTGIYRYNGSDFAHYTTTEGLASNTVMAISFYSDGMPVVADNYGQISEFDGSKWKALDILTGNDYIYDMTIDAANNIWLATYQGIIRCNETGIQRYFNDNEYGQYYINFIYADKNGLIWAGNPYYGLLVFNGTDWIKYDIYNGLSSNYTTAVMLDSKKRMWVLTDNGINMSANFTSIDEPGAISSGKIVVYPNPFSESFDIQYSSNKAGFADIHVFSADGRLVKQYSQQKVDMGENTFHFESENWPDGLLFCKIIMSGFSENIKLLKVSTH